MPHEPLTYRAAGVDIDEAQRALRAVSKAVQTTHTNDVIGGIGGFGGLFRGSFPDMAKPTLVSSIDGVGTKTKIAAMVGEFSGLGKDIVNHCVNDILCQGARPLFFLDYYGCSKLSGLVFEEVLHGMAEACRDVGCALIGGETAEMPGVYHDDEIDIVGTEATGADMVSEMVALNRESLAERALVPAFIYFFQLLYPFGRVNDPASATAAAAGGTVLIRRAALARIGGIAAIADRLIDDCALAAKVKPGGRIWLGHSALARSIRRYPGFSDIWRMIARSAYVQLRHSPLLLLGTVAGLGLVFLAPPGFALFGDGSARLAGGLAWAGMAASFLPTLRRCGASPLWAPLLPAIAAFYLAATIGAAIDHHRGRGVVWKSRAYSAGRA